MNVLWRMSLPADSCVTDLHAAYASASRLPGYRMLCKAPRVILWAFPESGFWARLYREGNFFWRKYAHSFSFLLRNHLDSTLTLRNPQKANLQKKHACAVGRPPPGHSFLMVFWLSWPLKYLCPSGLWHLTSSGASTRTPSTSSCATTLTVP